MLDIPDVIFDPSFYAGVASEAVNLSPTGDSGTNLLSYKIKRYLFLELVNIEWNFRSGTDKAHVSNEHIKELGKLIETELTDNAAEFGLTVILILTPARGLGGASEAG